MNYVLSYTIFDKYREMSELSRVYRNTHKYNIDGDSHMYCPKCGAQLQFDDAEICPKCGVRIKAASSSEIKSTGIAAIASFVIPGLGQIYCGKIGRGIMILIGAVICCLLIIVIIGIVLAPIYWIWNIYDAYTLAKKINSGEIKEE